MTAIKPSPSPSASTDTPRRSRAHPHSSSSPTSQQQQYTMAASFSSSHPHSLPPHPLSSSLSSSPSPSALPLTHTLAPTYTHDPSTTTKDIDIDINIANNNTPTSTRHTHHRSSQTRQDHPPGKSSNSNNHIHTHHHHSRHHRHNNITSSSSRRSHHIRRHSASAYYAGPVDHDRVIHTANAHAEAEASGILSPRRRQSRLLLSPRGPQPQRHLLRQQRKQQQQLLRHQQQRQPQSFLLHIPQHLHQQQQEEQEQQHHTSRRGASYSKPPSVSPSSLISIFSPPMLNRSSSMPLLHTQPLDMQVQEEAASKFIRQAQLLAQQPLFSRSRQHSRRHRQPMVESVTDQEQDPVKPIDEPPPDPRLIRQKLLQLQDIQQREERQQEQRRMQAFRIKKFSQDSSSIAELDYRPSTTIFKEGFQEHWGDPILEHQSEKLDEDLQGDLTLTHCNFTQQDDLDVEVAKSDDEHDDSYWKEQRRRQRQQEQEMMDTDSAMETDKTGDGDRDGDGDGEMDPHTRLLHARKVKEDAMKDYEEASRILLRAKEREQAILYEYEADLIEVEVGSSVSQQLHRHPGGHGLGHLFQNSSPLIQQQRQQQHELEERGRLSSPITTAAAAAAVACQIQDESNNEGMLNSQIVPQVNGTPSVFSEAPQVAMAPTSLLSVLAPSASVPTRALTPMTSTTTENQVPNQTRSGNQARSRSQSVTSNNEAQTIAPPPQLRRHSNSPRIKIKSEEQDESFLKKYFLGSGRGVTGSDRDSKRRWQPRYEDFDITIEIPSSVGSSDVGVSGQPESSNAKDRGKQREKSERQLPDRWRSPTPVPPSMFAKREAAEASWRRPQWMSLKSTRPPQRFGPGGLRTPKVVPVDLLGGRGESSQQQQQQRSDGSSSRPVLLSPRLFVPRPRPYPQPPISPVRRDSRAQVPVGGGGLPSNFFEQGMPTRPPRPSSPSSPPSQQQQQQQQQHQGQGQGRSSPLAAPTLDPAAAFAEAGAAAFTGPTAAPTPRYASASNPQAPSRLHNLFVDENGRPYQSVVFYTHIERIENFHQQHIPTSTPSRGVSASPRSARESPNIFTTRFGGGGGMEDVRGGGGYEDVDAAMEGEQQRQQVRSRTTSRTNSRQADRDDRQEEERGERKPRPKSEVPFL